MQDLTPNIPFREKRYNYRNLHKNAGLLTSLTVR